MFSTLLICANLLSAAPVDTGPTPADLQSYRDTRSKVGADSEAHVRLALWCEQRGLLSERDKHLALAILNDPTNAAARGLMGAVDFDGRWERPEAVAAKIKADEALVAKLAEYNARREGLRDNADAHAKLAQWCEENGLAAEAKAHLASVVRLDPSRDGAWKKLGMKKVGGRWITAERLAAEKADADAQRKADRRWKPILARLRADLRAKSERDRERARAELDAVDDPRAVPSVWAVLVQSDMTDQETAVRVLGRIDGPGSSRTLSVVALFSESPEARRAATEVLMRRDGRDFLGTVIDLVKAPVRYEVRPTNGPDLPGELFVEGERAIFRRVYLTTANLNQALAQVPPRLFDASVPFNPVAEGMNMARPIRTSDSAEAAAAQTRLNALQRDGDIARSVRAIREGIQQDEARLERDVAAIEANNVGARRLNERAFAVLIPNAGRNVGESPDEWRSWWADQQGYVYEPSLSTEPKPVITQVFESSLSAAPIMPAHSACFAAGTPVQTMEGPKAIETVSVGDRVLSQDVTTGRLKYTAVLVPIRNKPSQTFRVTAGNNSVVATAIHRFWKAGEGWAMTRDLKPGDVLRTAGGLARVESVEPVGVQPVFNLEVAESQTYFVGDSAFLVHDNAPVQPVSEPFDARPTLAEVVAKAE